MGRAERKLDDLCRVVSAYDARPDDIAVARMWSRLEHAGQQPPEPAATPVERGSHRLLAVGAAVACVALVSLWRFQHRARMPMVATVDTPGVVELPSPPPLASDPSSRLRTWQLRANETLRTNVAAIGTIRATGPTTLSLRRERDDRYTFQQDGGELAIDGRTTTTPVAVVTRHFRVDMVGASFAVDDGSQRRVRVVSGRVSIHWKTGAAEVRGGQTWQRGRVTSPPRPKPTRALPARPERSKRPATKPARAAATKAMPPKPAPPPKPPTRVDPPSIAAMYAHAERDMRAENTAAAIPELTRIARHCPAAVEACDALYDLARLEAQRGNKTTARRYLDRLERQPVGGSLRAAARSLRRRLVP